jgi:hypothetical protein
VRLRLALLSRVFATWMKLRMLDELARVTAQGFGAEAPRWAGRAFNSRLAEYGRFTAREAEALVAGGAGAETRARLYSGARGLGERLRRGLGLRGAEDAFAAFRLLYGHMGIEVSGGPGLGEVRVDRCFFAAYYSEPVCGVVEALDRGLAEGLFGGASLEFRQRLMAGAPCCRARLLVATFPASSALPATAELSAPPVRTEK